MTMNFQVMHFSHENPWHLIPLTQSLSGLRFSNSALHLLRFTNHNLVGGFNPSEKYEFVSWDYEIPN